MQLHIFNRGGNAISNALAPIDGVAFYSTNDDIKGKGSGMRQSQYPTGPMVDIDLILGTATAATSDPSKAIIGGSTAMGKITSVIEMMKEALGFGLSVGDVVSPAFPTKPGQDNKAGNAKAKFSPEGLENAADSAINANPDYSNASYGTSPDSSFGLINYSNGFGEIKTDTLKPKEKKMKKNIVIILMYVSLGLWSCSQKKDPILKYYPKGALKSEETSINDSLSLYRSYFEDGTLHSSIHSINGFASGRARLYFQNGKLAQDCELKNGLPNGKCVIYYPTGNIFTIINYKDSVNIGNAYQYYDIPGKKIKYLTNYSIVHGKKWANWQIQYDSLGNVTKTTTKLKRIIAPSEVTIGDSLKLEFYLEYPQYPKTKVYYGDYDDDFDLIDTSSIKGSYGSKNAVTIYVKPKRLGKETVRGILENYKVLDSLKSGLTKSEGKMIYWSYDYNVVK